MTVPIEQPPEQELRPPQTSVLTLRANRRIVRRPCSRCPFYDRILDGACLPMAQPGDMDNSGFAQVFLLQVCFAGGAAARAYARAANSSVIIGLRVRVARVDATIGRCAGGAGGTLLVARELAVAGIALAAALQAVSVVCGLGRDRRH